MAELKQEVIQILALKRLSLDCVMARLDTRGFQVCKGIVEVLQSLTFLDDKEKYVLQPQFFVLADPDYEGYTAFERKIMRMKMTQIKVKALAGKDLKQRVLHAIAPGALSYRCVDQRLREEGCKHSDDELIQVLKMCSDMDTSGRHCLRTTCYDDLDLAWPGWSPNERKLMQPLMDFHRSLEKMTKMMEALEIADPTFRGGKRSRQEEVGTSLTWKRRRQL